MAIIETEPIVTNTFDCRRFATICYNVSSSALAVPVSGEVVYELWAQNPPVTYAVVSDGGITTPKTSDLGSALLEVAIPHATPSSVNEVRFLAAEQ